jgi:hypothetical protein
MYDAILKGSLALLFFAIGVIVMNNTGKSGKKK